LAPGGIVILTLAIGEQESPLKAIDIDAAVSGVANLFVGAAAFLTGDLFKSATAGAEGVLAIHNSAVQLVNGITTNQDEVVGATSIVLRNDGMGKLAFGSYPHASTTREETRTVESRTFRLTGAGGNYTLKLRLDTSIGAAAIRPLN
jgi:hypothetical protein